MFTSNNMSKKKKSTIHIDAIQKTETQKKKHNEINFISISLVTNFTFCSMKSRKKLNTFFEKLIMLYTLHQTHFLSPTNKQIPSIAFRLLTVNCIYFFLLLLIFSEIFTVFQLLHTLFLCAKRYCTAFFLHLRQLQMCVLNTIFF